MLLLINEQNVFFRLGPSQIRGPRCVPNARMFKRVDLIIVLAIVLNSVTTGDVY